MASAPSSNAAGENAPGSGTVLGAAAAKEILLIPTSKPVSFHSMAIPSTELTAGVKCAATPAEPMSGAP